MFTSKVKKIPIETLQCEEVLKQNIKKMSTFLLLELYFNAFCVWWFCSKLVTDFFILKKRNGCYKQGKFPLESYKCPKVKAKSLNLAWDWIKGNMYYASNGVSLNLKGTKRWRKKIGDMILLIGTSGWRNTALIGLLTLPLTGRGALGWSGGPAYPHSSLLY